MISLELYLDLKDKVCRLGYWKEVDWSCDIRPPKDGVGFWREFAWVVINSGMKEQIARCIWRKVRPCVERGGSCSDVFGHKGKASAIDEVWCYKDHLLGKYLASPDKVEWCRTLPWIGDVTKWHLAKNLGFDCVKPDRHIVRIFGIGCLEECRRLANESGDRLTTVDTVIWRAANLGMI